MKPIITKSDKVLEELFKGNEVLHISFNTNGKPFIQRLTVNSIENVRTIVGYGDKSQFFVALKEGDSDNETPTEPPVEPAPEEPKEPEGGETEGDEPPVENTDRDLSLMKR